MSEERVASQEAYLLFYERIAEMPAQIKQLRRNNATVRLLWRFTSFTHFACARS